MKVNLLLIGPPGGGKGTQAALLKRRLGLRALASGDIFRQEVSQQSDLGKLATSYMNQGALVPDEVTINMMAKYVGSPESRERGFVLDGFPRTVNQAEALDQLLNSLKLQLSRVLSIELNDETIVKRLSARRTCGQCGEVFHLINNPPSKAGICDRCQSELVVRSDDDPDTIRERLRVFREKTGPVIDYYQSKGLLTKIDGSKDPEAVYQAITAAIPTLTSKP